MLFKLKSISTLIKFGRKGVAETF